LRQAVEKAKIGNTDKREAIKSLHQIASNAEKDFVPNMDFEKVIEQERKNSWKYGGRTVFGKEKPPKDDQLKLF
jgi:hypothetical protein